MSGDGPNLASQQQAMNHGKSKGGHPTDINSAFGKDADYMTTLMHGKDVQLFNAAAQTLAQMLGGDKTGNSSGGDGGGSASGSSVGRGGGADAIQPSAPSGGLEKFTENYYADKAHGKKDRDGGIGF